MAEKRETLSGLTAEEAQEFHKYMVQGTAGFVGLTPHRPHLDLGMAALVLKSSKKDI